MVCDSDVTFQVALPRAVRNARRFLSRYDMVLVSGYLLLQARARAFTVRILTLSREVGAASLLDLVPHDIFTRMSRRAVREATTISDVVAISSVSAPPPIGGADATPERARRVYNLLNPRRTVLLTGRHGREALSFDGTGYRRYVDVAAHRGRSDTHAIAEVVRLLSRG
jgi:hypothetical protein